MKTQTVQAIMHKQPISVQCQTPLATIIETLIESQQLQLPVINQNKKLIGMVSLIDCQNALLIGAYHCDQPIKVNDIMAKDFTSLATQQALSEVAIQTQQQTESIFPVLESGKLVGILRRVDLLNYLYNNFSQCTVA
jgi:predicted transcriptional regulator